MIRSTLWFGAELLFALVFVAATAYPSLLGYSAVACTTGAAGWALALLVVLPIGVPLVAAAWIAIAVAIAFGVQWAHAVARLRTWLTWSIPGALGAGLVVAAVAATLGLQARCSFGF